MTPAQRAYFMDLVRSMRQRAQWVDRKLPTLAVVLNQGADALETCANTLKVTEAPASSPAVTPTETEPAA